MHRQYTFATQKPTRRLPPFGAVGWFAAILAEQARRRAIRHEFSGMSPALLRDVGLTEGDVDAVRLRKLAEDAASGLAATIRERADNW